MISKNKTITNIKPIEQLLYVINAVDCKRDDLENINKILLPQSILYKLVSNCIYGPYIYNINKPGKMFNNGIIEFTAPDNCCIMSENMLKNICSKDGIVKISLENNFSEKKYIKIQPYETETIKPIKYKLLNNSSKNNEETKENILELQEQIFNYNINDNTNNKINEIDEINNEINNETDENDNEIDDMDDEMNGMDEDFDDDIADNITDATDNEINNN